jgi:hypothetical protein
MKENEPASEFSFSQTIAKRLWWKLGLTGWGLCGGLLLTSLAVLIGLALQSRRNITYLTDFFVTENDKTHLHH